MAFSDKRRAAVTGIGTGIETETGHGYAELQVTSNFSFLRGGSHPGELATTAAKLGHKAIAITDRNSLAGVVRAHNAAKEAGIKLVVGARLDLMDGPSLLCFPTDRAAYGRLARLITLGRRRAPKGDCELYRSDVFEYGTGQLFIALPSETPDAEFCEALRDYRRAFGKRLWLAASHRYQGNDAKRLHRLAVLARETSVPLVATNDVHYHEAARKPLQDVLTCVREKCTIDQAGWRLAANAERHLKPADEMTRLFRHHPEAIAETCAIAEACRFSLDELRYEYPEEVTSGGRTPQQELVHLTWAAAEKRYPAGIPDKVAKAVTYELSLIEQLDYAPYFLTVYDLVRFARARGILCQGRGSAANSAVCYCLGITSVDPATIDLLFERFVSAERDEPPDIDVDFEHERREEVIQYIYDKYGRQRAGLTATVITYRTKSALREVGKVMGLSGDVIERLQRALWRESINWARIQEEGFDITDQRLLLTLKLARALLGFPRHLSQHTGGFVISRGPLCEVVPIENAAMDDRTVIEWDKDDLSSLGMIKIDVLALGMLTCIRKGFDLLRRHYDLDHDLASVPQEDKATYDMLCKADSVGVFQVESRAQMTMLPRLRPRTFYDLVIEVAIVRPGPIQGGMVHPYLRRRSGKEAVHYPSEELKMVLEKTLGVPLFQEQAMKIAIVAAGFTPTEADQLRRAMATFRHMGTIHHFERKLIDGMVARGYDPDFSQRVFKQIEGFGDYGFPESHAASFALLAYISAWFKCHHPEVFACALLNSQPMGFYAAAQIVRDAREHDVEVRPADINHSIWDCTLETATGPYFALRLGLRQVKGLKQQDAEDLIAKRQGGYRSAHDLWQRTGLGRQTLERLAKADCFGSLGVDRRQAAWQVKSFEDQTPLPLFAALTRTAETEPGLPAMQAADQVVADYRSTGLSLKGHPMDRLRARLTDAGIAPTAKLLDSPTGSKIAIAGVVLARQRPGTAKKVMFITLEDETGVANLVVFAHVFERFRKDTLSARILACYGRVENHDNVIHLIAEKLTSVTSTGDNDSFLSKGRFFH